MKRTIYILLSCCLVSGISSCGKKGAAVKVTVFDKCLNQYVSGAIVGLFENHHHNNTETASKITENSTDINGEVLFDDFKTNSSNDYGYYVQVTNYFGQQSDFSTSNSNPIDKGTYNDRHITMISSAHLLVKFITPPPYPGKDSLFVNFRQKYTGYNYDKTSYNYSEGYAKVDAGEYYITIKKYYPNGDTVSHPSVDTVNVSGAYARPFIDSIFIAPNSSKEYDVMW